MFKRKTLQQFIQDAQKVHGEKYDYSLVQYKGDNLRIIIICPKHGHFLQTANTHLQGSGCTKCGYQNNSDRALKHLNKTTDVKVGDKYGWFTVIKPVIKSNKWNHRRSLVRCKCGGEYAIRTRDFVVGLTKKCKRCGQFDKIIKPIIGTKYGNWIVISEEIEMSYHNKFKVRCKCGLEKFISHVALRAGQSKMCHICARKAKKERLFTGIGELTGSYFASLKFGCNRSVGRILDFTITKEYLWDLFLKQKRKCALSGVDIIMHSKRIQQTASLDRIDSSKGYIFGNVQWVHKIVNAMKQDVSEKEFYKWCQLIVKYGKK